MKKSIFIAIAIAVVTVAWFMSGSGGNSQGEGSSNYSAENSPQSEELEGSDDLTEVRVRDLVFEWMIDDVTITGRTRASRKISMKAEIDGQIAEILIDKGAAVKKGDVIAKLEIKSRAASVREAEQLLEQRQIQYNAAKELEQKGFNSRVRLAEARAQLESARAGLKKARIELSDTSIQAPFDGVIDGQHIEIGDFVSVGQDLFDLVDLDPLEIVGFVTEKQIMRVDLGSEADISLSSGKTAQGTVTYIATSANADTRTFEVEVSLPNENYAIKEGITSQITIPLEQQKAYRISPSVLSLTDEGAVGIKIIDENDRVQFVPVIFLKDTPEFLWISGLPDKIRLITVGQEFVTDGQVVKPVSADGEGLL
ncbi:MAG: efflux RND transporter periplasmic adaptor subunit [Alphaproteobacteria bacterium]|nr:efflux RND transporter periplasmic adaptor subunit [Alphaproteobacteria bacterium]